MRIEGTIGHISKKQIGRKCMATHKNGSLPHVFVAADDADAKKKWAKRTGQKETDCKVTFIGTKAESMADKRRKKEPEKAPDKTK